MKELRCPHCKDDRGYFIDKKRVADSTTELKCLYIYCCLECGTVYGFTGEQLQGEEKK